MSHCLRWSLFGLDSTHERERRHVAGSVAESSTRRHEREEA
jgi:hypothetical protein